MVQDVQGIGVSPGVALGPAFVITEMESGAAPEISPADELAALNTAMDASVAELEEINARLRAEGRPDEAGIMDAQALMLRDPGLLDRTQQGIAAGQTAVEAVQMAAEQYQAAFEALDDPYLAGRAADVRDVAGRLCRRLLGRSEMPALPRPSIIVAHELTPSQTVALDRSLVLGFATDVGNQTSHTAILARALNIPAVVGLRNVTELVHDGEEMALDGETGIVLIRPGARQREAYAEGVVAREERNTRLAALRGEPAVTRDGHRVILAANIGSPDEIPAALEAGAEGVGLFRTEFLFAGRDHMPSEDEQAAAYQSVLAAMAPHTVVIRTLDVGGDKPLPYLPQPRESNPFLGERGIRYTLAHPEILRRQLRALLRASSAGRLSIMFPMITTLGEIERTRAILAEEQRVVGGEATVGIMVEVPATALVTASLAAHVAFFSVGTNDLTQYALAVDRTDERIASLYSPLHPGVLRLLAVIVEGARRHGRQTAICGELAGDPLAVPLLVGFGFDELSMSPSRIPPVKERIRSLELTTCRDLARQAVECATESQVRRLIEQMAPHPDRSR